AHQVGQVEHVVWLHREHRLDHVVHQRDITAKDLDLRDEVRVVRWQIGVDVERGDLVATLNQLAEYAVANESGAAEDENVHDVHNTAPNATATTGMPVLTRSVAGCAGGDTTGTAIRRPAPPPR